MGLLALRQATEFLCAPGPPMNFVAQASRRRVGRASRPAMGLAARRRLHSQPGTAALPLRRFRGSMRECFEEFLRTATMRSAIARSRLRSASAREALSPHSLRFNSHCPVARHGASHCLDTFRQTGLICRLASKVGHRYSKQHEISLKTGQGYSKKCDISSKLGQGSSKNHDTSSKIGRRSSKHGHKSSKNHDVS